MPVLHPAGVPHFLSGQRTFHRIASDHFAEVEPLLQFRRGVQMIFHDSIALNQEVRALAGGDACAINTVESEAVKRPGGSVVNRDRGIVFNEAIADCGVSATFQRNGASRGAIVPDGKPRDRQVLAIGCEQS